MAMTNLPGFLEYPMLWSKESASPTPQQQALNATGYRMHIVGNVVFEGGYTASTKTISNAGGKIHWLSGSTATVFANAGSNLRVGIQDVSTASSPAQGDGTFDVYKDLVGGTDPIATSSVIATTMANGSKTLSHGDLIAIVIDLTARAGSDDVRIAFFGHPYGNSTHRRPAVVRDTTSLLRIDAAPNAIIEFDDGTFGWLYGTMHYTGMGAANNFSSSTGTADEYGNLFQINQAMQVMGVVTLGHTAGHSSDFELLLYSDPLGTPSVLSTITVDATQMSTTFLNGIEFLLFSEPVTLSVGTVYAATYRPTTTNNVTLPYADVSVAGHFINTGVSSDDCYAVRRLDNTGAFSDFNGGTAKTRRMGISLLVSAFDLAEAAKGRAVTAIGI